MEMRAFLEHTGTVTVGREGFSGVRFATTPLSSAFGSAWKFFAIADFLTAEGGEGVSNLREAPREVDKDDVVCESSWDTCALGVDDAALFRHQSIDTLLDAQFWQRLCPFLTVTDAPLADDAEELAGDAPAHGRRQDLLSGDGYFRMTADEVAIPAHQAELLACGVRRLQAHGYPATAVLMYDEAWALLALLRRHVQGTSCATRRLDPSHSLQTHYLPLLFMSRGVWQRVDPRRVRVRRGRRGTGRGAVCPRPRPPRPPRRGPRRLLPRALCGQQLGASGAQVLLCVGGPHGRHPGKQLLVCASAAVRQRVPRCGRRPCRPGATPLRAPFQSVAVASSRRSDRNLTHKTHILADGHRLFSSFFPPFHRVVS